VEARSEPGATSAASRPLLGDAQLEMLATNDVLWDRIVSITSVGEEEVYDATVLGSHNFVADGVAVHNSIEQDADMVGAAAPRGALRAGVAARR
jgi:hypothetical protein